MLNVWLPTLSERVPRIGVRSLLKVEILQRWVIGRSYVHSSWIDRIVGCCVYIILLQIKFNLILSFSDLLVLSNFPNRRNGIYLPGTQGPRLIPVRTFLLCTRSHTLTFETVSVGVLLPSWDKELYQHFRNSECSLLESYFPNSCGCTSNTLTRKHQASFIRLETYN